MMETFLEIPEERIIHRNDSFFIIRDAFPVSPGHLLIISNRICRDYFELSEVEKHDLTKTIDTARFIVEQEYRPDGYNVGMNCGVAAGQTVFHFHCHVIPRYNGDMEDPRGGVRHCVQGKGRY
jgi:diadenosine tetraphosphate (Ap4A) HIT family hydrolase